jgi:hypothetical protein
MSELLFAINPSFEQKNNITLVEWMSIAGRRMEKSVKKIDSFKRKEGCCMRQEDE